MKVYLLLVVGAIALVLAGCAPDTRKPMVDADLGEALHYAESGDTAVSYNWVNQAIAVDPNDRTTYYDEEAEARDDAPHDIFSVYEPLHDDVSLIRYMSQAAKAFPDDYDVLMFLADAQQEIGDTAGEHATGAKAALVIDKVMKTPGVVVTADLSGKLGMAYWQAGNLPVAETTLENVVKTHPKDDKSLNLLAWFYADANITQHLADAVTLAKKAITIEQNGMPSDDDVYGAEYTDTLGWAEYRLHDVKDAASDVQDAAYTIPREPVIRYHLAQIYLALNKKSDAIVELNHALMLAHDYADASNELKALGQPPPRGASPSAPVNVGSAAAAISKSTVDPVDSFGPGPKSNVVRGMPVMGPPATAQAVIGPPAKVVSALTRGPSAERPSAQP